MINGKGNLKDMYPNLDKDQLQPAGVDLTLDKVMCLETNNNLYGLFLHQLLYNDFSHLLLYP